MIIDTLITDRTQTDVDTAKALVSIGWQKMTAAERVTMLTALKGSYNFTDYNRCGAAIQYLADLLNGYGYSVIVEARTNWAHGEEPNNTERAAYMADFQTLKDAFYGTQEIPSVWGNLTIEEVNNVELLLLEITTYIGWMVAGFRKCGTFKSGQGVILP